jgi:hypothetical protein
MWKNVLSGRNTGTFPHAPRDAELERQHALESRLVDGTSSRRSMPPKPCASVFATAGAPSLRSQSGTLPTNGPDRVATMETILTARSIWTEESAAPSEVQWLLQAMGSGVIYGENAPITVANGNAVALETDSAKCIDEAESEDVEHGDCECMGVRWMKDACSGLWKEKFGGKAAGPWTRESARDAEATYAGLGRQARKEVVLEWDVEMQEASDKKCEESLAAVLQATTAIKAHVEVGILLLLTFHRYREKVSIIIRALLSILYAQGGLHESGVALNHLK